jgi:hypothetical protein
MPRSDHPSHSWQAQRHYLTAAVDSLNDVYVALNKWSDNIRTFLEIRQELEDLDQPLTLVLDYTTTSDTLEDTPPADPEPSRRITPRHEAERVRRAWTFEEDNLIVAGKKLGMTNEAIAQALGRTYSGVKNRANEMRHQGRL